MRRKQDAARRLAGTIGRSSRSRHGQTNSERYCGVRIEDRRGTTPKAAWTTRSTQRTFGRRKDGPIILNLVDLPSQRTPRPKPNALSLAFEKGETLALETLVSRETVQQRRYIFSC